MKESAYAIAALVLAMLACSVISGDPGSSREPRDTEAPTEDEPEPEPSRTRAPTRTPRPTATDTPAVTPTPVQDIPGGQEPDPYYVLASSPPDLNRGIGMVGGGGGVRCDGVPSGVVQQQGTLNVEPSYYGYNVGSIDASSISFCLGGDYSASAIAPDGSTQEAITIAGETDGIDPWTQVYLPLIAFGHPGTWRLIVDDGHVVDAQIDVPETSTPLIVADNNFGLFIPEAFIGVGFEPHERAAVIFVLAERQQPFGRVEFTVTYDAEEWMADATGVVGPVETQGRGGPIAMVYIVGETGNLAGFTTGSPIDFRPQDAGGDDIPPQSFYSLLYDAYWRSAPPLARCPGFLPSQLEEGGRGRVLSGPSNRLRDGPGMDFRIIDVIPGGGEFSIVKGPACAEGTAWWLVDYEGLQGWTAEGEEDEYWLEPLP